MAEKKNIVLIVVDTLRADHLSCNGYFRETDPHISQIAQEGVNFQNFFASGVPTGPGLTSIITGLWPINNNIFLVDWSNLTPSPISAGQLDDNIPTIAEIFRENGFQTASVDNYLEKHFIRGYKYHMNPVKYPYWLNRKIKPIKRKIRANKVNELASSWIISCAREPFFLFLRYNEPHRPYNQPKKYRVIWNHQPGSRSDLEVQTSDFDYKYVQGWGAVNDMIEEKQKTGANEFQSIDLYDGEIRYVDEKIWEIFNLLREKEFLENCIFVITADHGEQLGQHGLWGHKGLHDSVTHIPLIIHDQDLKRNKLVKELSHQADLLPTLVELSGAKITNFNGDAWPSSIKDFDGKPLNYVVSGKIHRDAIFTEERYSRAVRTKKWKFIQHKDGKEELYNISKDPMEKLNLSEKRTKKTSEMRRILHAWKKENIKGPRTYETVHT